MKLIGWHKEGYLANRVPPLTGSASAQISSKGSNPVKVLWPMPKACAHIHAYGTFSTYSRLGTLDLMDGAQAKRGVGRLGEVRHPSSRRWFVCLSSRLCGWCVLVKAQRHVPQWKHPGRQRRWSQVRTALSEPPERRLGL